MLDAVSEALPLGVMMNFFLALRASLLGALREKDVPIVPIMTPFSGMKDHVSIVTVPR
jgi:hypothetical protein